MMQPSGPQLRDIHLPPAPTWWPPAPGWWALGVVALLLAGVVIWFARKRRRVLRQRQAVMDELDRIVSRYDDGGDPATLISGLHQLLRRVARTHDASAVRQRGEAWRRTLSRVPLDPAMLEELVRLDGRLYRPPAEFDHAVTITAVRRWLQAALKPERWEPVESVDA